VAGSSARSEERVQVIATAELARAAAEALAWVRSQPDVRDAEVFAACHHVLVGRVCYTSHIPCNGLEEPKSLTACGLGLRVVLEGSPGPRVGFGSETGDLSPGGAERALARARAGATHDPEFVSLPQPGPERPVLADYHDPGVMTLDDLGFVTLGWRALQGALAAAAEDGGSPAALTTQGLVVGGDVTVLRERVALASTHLPEVRTDESTAVTAALTAMVEARAGKGSGWAVGVGLDVDLEAAGAGAVRSALATADGERVPAGEYAVVLGPQPVADLLHHLLLPALSARAFYAGSTPFAGRLGRPVASSLLHLYDHGALPGRAGSKAITCEGVPTGRTDLIRAGILVGCLSNWYETQRLLRDPALGRKLGATGPAAAAALSPRHGFRFGEGGARRFDLTPGIAATNVILEGTSPVSRDELLRTVGDGLYVGRIWYTYPVHGLRAGDFTCTVVGDSYIIRGGRLAAPLRPNAVRIRDNLERLLTAVLAVGRDVCATRVWAADEVAYVPEVAVRGVPVEAVAVGQEDRG
jgi:predicted Zn-dependent protease